MRHTRRILVMIYTLCLALVMQAQTTLSATPVTSTEGYEFYATFLLNGKSDYATPDMKLQLLVSSREENTIVVECGSNFRVERTIAAGTTEIIDIPAIYAYWNGYDDEIPKNTGVHIYSTNGKKMTVYAINQKGTNNSSFYLDGAHVLPKQALGNEYIVTSNSDETLAAEFVIMSTVAGTKVNIELPNNVQTTQRKTDKYDFTFKKPNQVYIVRSRRDSTDINSKLDLSGTKICADHPVAVWSGNQAALFPTGEGSAKDDHAFDQLLPIDRWGTQFIVPMTGNNMRINKLDIIARDDGTNVTITRQRGTGTISKTINLGSGEKWPELIDAYTGQKTSYATLKDSVFFVNANHPIQVHLHTSSGIYNVDSDLNKHGDPSMTMITALEHLTDTAVFATYRNPMSDPTDENKLPLKYELVVWAKSTTISSLQLNGSPVSTSLFQNIPGNSNYKYARIEVPQDKEGYQILTANEKGFGGYVCGTADGQACLYPIGYDFTSAVDSLFLSKQYEPKEVHGAEESSNYPEKAFGGGYYLDKIVLPSQPIQYDTIFVCDSSLLRFPAIIHDYSYNHGDSLKWEVMRINPGTKERTEYTDDEDARKAIGLSSTNPYLEAQFFVQPEKNLAPGRRSAHEDFEVRAVLYRKPTMCEEEDVEKWPKDTLSTIVRTYRSYNDTTWLIRCTNDPDIIEENGQYKIAYFYNPETEKKDTSVLVLGENHFSVPYTTIHGCDSIVTLYVLLCESKVKELDLGYLCEEDMKDLHDQQQFGEFFKNFDFLGTLKACKKTKTDTKEWTRKTYDELTYWQFKSTDVILKTDCSGEMQEWIDDHKATRHPSRTVLGCDSSLTITFYVWPIEEKEYEYTTCETQYTWSLDYNWYNGSFTKHINIPCRLSDRNMHEGTNDTIFEHPRSTYPPGTGWSRDACIGERHILHLTFLHHDDTRVKEKELCQDDPLLVISKATTDRDIKDPDFSWLFSPRDSIAGRTYFSREIPCENSDGCPYILQYKLTVNPVEIHYDTVVYCYEDGSQVVHKWQGHTRYWANEKGSSVKRPYHNETNPLRINRPRQSSTSDTRVIYELADTVVGTPCHTLYYQTVIVLPPYATTEDHAPVSTDQWFEWHDVIWAGREVNPDTVPSRGKTVVVLDDNPGAPAGWTVVSGSNMYSLTTTTQTRTYKRDDDSETETHPCDSTVTLRVPMAGVQEENKYDHTCSSYSPYIWQAGDTTIEVNLEDYYDDLSELPKEIHLIQHRKTVDDPSKTVYPWPVAGLDAYLNLYLTIFPSWRTTVADSACQAPGETYIFKDSTFYLDVPGWQEKGRPLETEPRTWIDRGTGISYEVRCDSGETVRFYVHPIYREDVNKELSTYPRTLYSYDTLSFFTEPRVLFVGEDFFIVHPEIPNMEVLKDSAKVDSAVIVSNGFSEILQRTTTQGMECDSTTFLALTVQATAGFTSTNLGDNGEILDAGATDIWHFGGDTTVARADGTRWHTQPYITGDYFRFYYDANGNVIVDDDGNPIEVDYTDTTDNRIRAGSRDYHYNEDGTRTYLLVDTVLNADGTFAVYVHRVVVYPTYLVSENADDPKEVCATDVFDWNGHFDKNGNVFRVNVAELEVTNRHAAVRDTLCAKRYEDRGICVDSIAVLELIVFGNGVVRDSKPRCFNDPAWSPEWNIESTSVCYDAGQTLPDTIRNVIPPTDPTVDCTDIHEVVVRYNPAYGVLPCQYDAADLARYRIDYMDPFISDAEICYGDDDFHWILNDGAVHNSYLFDANGNPIEYYTDAFGNPTNKMSGDTIPTYLVIGESYIVRDSLKTAGCRCDSVLTLNYKIRDALPPTTIDTTICDGEAYDFGGELLTQPVTGYVKFIQEPGKPCKTKTTLNLNVVRPSTFTIDPAPVCFPSEAYTNATYAIRYSYKGLNHPISYSVYYDENAANIGFDTIRDRTIVRSENEWKADSVYVLDLPMPQLDDPKKYPAPAVYHAKIGFKNGVCLGEDLMTYDFDVNIDYPAWVLEQRHGDLIAILDSAYNGGHNWNGFQWYENGILKNGYTKPYLYIPGGLREDAEYHVVLTETNELGDTISSAPTCPITIQALPNSHTDPGNDHGPSSDYIAVTPTCVPIGEFMYILSNENNSGKYRLSSAEGQFLKEGEFNGKATAVQYRLTVEGMYIIQVWSSKKESKESYRAIKVIVRESCPYCDKSSF